MRDPALTQKTGIQQWVASSSGDNPYSLSSKGPPVYSPKDLNSPHNRWPDDKSDSIREATGDSLLVKSWWRSTPRLRELLAPTTTPIKVRGSDIEITFAVRVRAQCSVLARRGSSPEMLATVWLSITQLRLSDIRLTGESWFHRMSQKEAAVRQATSSLQLLCEDAGCVPFQREARVPGKRPEQERPEDA